MLRIDDQLVYSATDLVGFLECEHLSNLERAAIWGHLDRPTRPDPVLDRIAQRGEQHEARFLASLQSEALSVVEIRPDEETPFRERVARGREATLSAMREGADVIYQAVLFNGGRLGYADFLVRVEQPSDLGPWGYEVWGHEARAVCKGIGRPAGLHVLGHGGRASGPVAREDASRARRRAGREGLVPRRRLRSLLPDGGARVRGGAASDPGLSGDDEPGAGGALRHVPVEHAV